MGNKILGKRSRNFYKGFNQRQLNYLKDKFESLSQEGKLKKDLFINAYQLDPTNDSLFEVFCKEADFDESGGIEEYEFICMVSYFCNLSVEELGKKFFSMLAGGKDKLTEKELMPFTSLCLRYNAYLSGKEVSESELKKSNKNKFRKYDYDKNKSIDGNEFCSICIKDEDYKSWLFNMGFITKNQMDHQDAVYDLVDSDIGEEIERQLKENNPNVDRIKRGIDNRQQDEEFQVEETVGEQSAVPSVKPWRKDLNKIPSKAYETSKVKDLSEEAPSQFLNLEYVLGYRSFDCRNNLRFDSQDRIIYHQAALGIMLTPSKTQYIQTYLNQHKDDITCLDGVGNTIVTGESGSKPMIIIWNTNKVQNGALQSEFIITKDLKESVGTVCLSPSQKYIAATCNDENHSLVVYDLEELKNLEKDLTSKKTGIVASGPLISSLVFDVRFEIGNEQSLAVATIRELLFVTIEKGVINSSRGDFDNFSSTMALCLLPLQVTVGKGGARNCMVAGMGNGSIYFWEKGKCIKAIVGHTGSVSALCKRQDNNSFISGDKTGKIIFWTDTFTKERSVNLPKTNSPSNMVVSLSQGRKKQLLIGTKGSEILLLNDKDGIEKAQKLMGGHSDGMIWSAALMKNDLFTGGEDQRLIKWHLLREEVKINSEKEMRTKGAVIEKEVKCLNKIRSLDCCQTNRSQLLAVGFVNGVINIYDPVSLQKKDMSFSKIKNPDQQVLNIVRFHQKEDILVVSYLCPKPKFVFLDLSSPMKKIGEIQLPGKVLSFDLSSTKKNPHYLRFNAESPQGQTYSILQFSLEKDSVKSKLMTQKFPVMDWQTHTCPFSPQTQGFFSEGVEEKDITCCASSLKYQNVIIAGDRFSRLKLFNYPCPFNKVYNKYEGHSNAITSILFNQEQNMVVSVGGQEKVIFIWKYDPVIVLNSYVLEIEKALEEVKKEEQNQFALDKAKGEEARCTDQFKGQIFPPSGFKGNPRQDNKPPKENVNIHHVFGIRSSYINDEVRNQGRFSQDGSSILFPTACMAIKMDIQSKNQEIFLQHQEDIVSFAVTRDRTIMATGQMAEKNLKNPRKKILSIYVWDIANKKSLVKLDGFHSIAVVLLEFSPSGKLLFSCGNDQKNSYAVYDWRAKTILYSGPVSRAKVNGICWKSECQFVTCGNDHVKFWNNGKGSMGKFKSGQTEGQVCVVGSGNYTITGGAKGSIFVWSGNFSPSRIKAHVGKVQCLVERKSFVYSGGSDGRILRWKKSGSGSISENDVFLDSRNAFVGKNLTQIQYGVLSLDFQKENSDESYLIITKGCSAVVCSKGSFNLVTQGHYSGELWGLATNYSSDIFVTGGDDESVRMWNIDGKKQVARVNFDKIVRGIDWSPDGKSIVCADGMAQIRLLNTSLGEIETYSGVPAKKNKNGVGFVEEIKFSPDSKMVVYGTHGQSKTIEFLKVEGKSISLYNSFDSGISSAFLHADWSKGSDAISINTQAAELLIFSINTKKKSSSASSYRDQPWATWTQKFGFPVQGIYQNPDYSDINTVCRDPTGKFLAVGYDDQTIRLFKYPCYIPKQVHQTLYGHSSHVTRVRFTPKYMVSTGGLDRTIIVWNIDRGEQEIKAQENDEDDDALSDLDEDVDLPQKILKNRKSKKKEGSQEFELIQAEGDQFMAIKPWLGAIKEPTGSFPKQTPKAPSSTLDLEYVHGYRTKDCRQNLFFSYKEERVIIFHAAAVLIYHDTKQNKQTLLTNHNDDILSIDYHRATGGVITGELGPKPLVNFYKNAELVKSFKAPVTKGVLALSISPDGGKAIAVGMDNDHYLALLDLEKGTVICTAKGGKKVILKVGWLQDNEFVTIGIRHFKHWTIEGGKMKGKDGNDPANLVSLAIGRGKILTGASQGTIFSWNKNKGALVATLKKPTSGKKEESEDNAEQRSITSVVQSISIQDDFVAAGTKDGFIFILNERYDVLNSFSLVEILKPFKLVSEHPSVRSLDFSGNKMLVGTFGSQIFQIESNSFKSKNAAIDKALCHLKCHYSPNNSWTNEVWGLHTDGDLAFTCSDDATLRCWSISGRKLLSIASLNLNQNKGQWTETAKDQKTRDFIESSKGRSVCISPDKKFIVVGCKEGTVRIFKFDEESKAMTMFQLFKHATEWISQIKFGYNLLIIGSHDNGIYVYDYDPDENTFKRKYKPMKKHSSYITHCDVSRDSCFLQSTCGAYQLLFWDLNTGKQITGGASLLRDQRWATWTSTLGWPVQGIYPKCTDGTFIHSVDRSHSSVSGTNYKQDAKTPYLLAAGNNKGEVCLYNYPCTLKSSDYQKGIGHSSHITTVRWTSDDERVISVGGQDQCVMYWKVKKI